MKIDRDKLEQMIQEEIQQYLDEVNPAHSADGTFAAKGKGKTYSLTKNAEDNPTAKNLEKPARGKITKKGKVSAPFGMNTGSPEKQCGRLTLDGEKKTKTRSCKDYPKTYTEETDYIQQKKKATARKNVDKNKLDSIPRDNDSPSIRREKVFPGSAPLWSLARGIAQEEMEKELPRWDKEGRLLPNSNVQEQERDISVDDSYLKGMIQQAVLSGIQQARAQAAKQGQRYSWEQVMRLIQDLETAQKGAPKEK